MKLFTIPHIALSGSSGLIGWNAYVPTGRLIIVDRTPYNREWAKDSNRGTSQQNEGIECQTNDGLTIGTSITIGASVKEQDAAKFLHFFGVNNPPGNRSDPDVIFASVYYGRNLEQVMDTVGRGLVEAAVCKAIGGYDFANANKNYNPIMDVAEATAMKFLGDRGVTVDYMGWAGTWTFDKDVQQAVNDKYTGTMLAPVIGTLQSKAVIDALERWDTHLPTTLGVVGGNLGELIGQLAPQAKR